MLGLSLHQYLPPIWLLASLPAFLLCYFFGLQDKFIQHHNPQLTIFSQHLLRAPWLWYSYTDLRECPLFELRGSYLCTDDGQRNWPPVCSHDSD